MIKYVDRNVQGLLHIITSIKRLKSSLAEVTHEDFIENTVLQDATSFSISMIGEAASHISEEFQEKHPEIPWVKMIGIRNRLVHTFDYDQINYDIVWDVATEDIPELEEKIRCALSTIPLPEDFVLPEV